MGERRGSPRDVPGRTGDTMRAIYKYHFPFSDNFTLSLPKNHQIVHVEMQSGEPTMWVLLDPNDNVRGSSYAVVGTGRSIPDAYSYIDTFQQPPFVSHLFAAGEPRRSAN